MALISGYNNIYSTCQTKKIYMKSMRLQGMIGMLNS